MEETLRRIKSMVEEKKKLSMKELLEEANKMLRMLRKEKGAEEERRRSAKDGRLDRLQQ